ncbi:ribonuclease hi [Plakobranchus ocellatus]|uniref:Ribonuclease hi n=1 Tax=Plakobranchus ocellatus TaxID=259542 RepID=A0AAV3YFS7_9GAST|nr:ribonuclease hi [Plakobranchus ocellatus]
MLQRVSGLLHINSRSFTICLKILHKQFVSAIGLQLEGSEGSLLGFGIGTNEASLQDTGDVPNGRRCIEKFKNMLAGFRKVALGEPCVAHPKPTHYRLPFSACSFTSFVEVFSQVGEYLMKVVCPPQDPNFLARRCGCKHLLYVSDQTSKLVFQGVMLYLELPLRLCPHSHSPGCLLTVCQPYRLFKTKISKLDIGRLYNSIRKFNVGIQGNENVDKLAKAALNRASCSGKLICWSDLKPKVNFYIHTVWLENWDAEGANKLHGVLPNLGEDLSKRGEGAGRKWETVMCRLRVGHTWLTQSYLLKNEYPNSLFCYACESLYTVWHILIECPDFQITRRQYFIVTDLYRLF